MHRSAIVIMGLLASALLVGGCAGVTERDEYVAIQGIKVHPSAVPESELALAPVIGVASFGKPALARLGHRNIASDMIDLEQ